MVWVDIIHTIKCLLDMVNIKGKMSNGQMWSPFEEIKFTHFQTKGMLCQSWIWNTEGFASITQNIFQDSSDQLRVKKGLL